MNILKFAQGDIAEMKKAHPCGSKKFKIMRVGSDVRAICCVCGRDLTLDRVKFEKSVKKILTSESEESKIG